MSITMLLGTMFGLLGETNKPLIAFFSEMFETVFSMRGRVNFTNLARYSGYNESTFRRRFGQNFDWLSLNSMIIGFSSDETATHIAAVDCSFVKKSGSATFGLDHYWCGSTGHSEKGLEISALAIIEVPSGHAWALDVVQTPAHLNPKGCVPTQEGSVCIPSGCKKVRAAERQRIKEQRVVEQTAKNASVARAKTEKKALKKQLKIEKGFAKVLAQTQKRHQRTQLNQMEDLEAKKEAKKAQKEAEKAEKEAKKAQKEAKKAQKETEKAEKEAKKAQKETEKAEKEVKKTYSRIDFYIEQLLDCLWKLTAIDYIVADGFYAKSKFLQALREMGKHFITKLRPDANVWFDFRGDHPKKQGPKAKYAGKAVFNDLTQWDFDGQDAKYDFLSVYSRICYSPQFECWLKVVLVLNPAQKKYVLLASTDLQQSALQILTFYQFRFQIEFLFRDAKQFTGLNHCQARDDAKLDFHFNMSLTAVNLIHALQRKDPAIKSINDWTRKMYNTKIVKNLLEELSLTAEFELSNPSIQNVINLGAMY